MDFEEMDLKRIREEYLHLPLREMAKSVTALSIM